MNFVDTPKQQSYDIAGRKLFIAIPAYDFKISLKSAISLAQFAQLAAKHGVGLVIGNVSGCSVVSKARNLLVKEFMATDCTDMLFIDADINFDPTDVTRLLAWTIDRNVVAAVPRTRKTDGIYIAVLDNTSGYLEMDEVGLVKAGRVATAFMMIQRKVIETLVEKHPEWQYVDPQSGETLNAVFDFKVTPAGYMGEDFLFCERAREHGFDVWIDPTIKLGHMGVQEYPGDYGNDVLYPMIADQQKKDAEAAMPTESAA